MNRDFIILGGVVVFLVLVGVYVFYLGGGERDVDLGYLDSLRASPPEDYVEVLGSIIEDNPEPALREEGVSALTDIALRLNESDKIVDLLKETASGDEDAAVRTSAYAGLDLIRDKVPLERRGSLMLSVLGDIKPGSDISLVATVSSSMDLEEAALVGITSLPNEIVLLTDDGVEKVHLEADTPVEVTFPLRLKESDEYYVGVSFKLTFDEFDYEKIHKELYLVVNDAGGEYSQFEE